MNEQQIDVIGIQFAQTFFNAGSRFCLTCMANPHLSNQEKLLTCDATLAPCTTNTLLIAIGLRRIYQAIAHFQRIAYAAFALI